MALVVSLRHDEGLGLVDAVMDHAERVMSAVGEGLRRAGVSGEVRFGMEMVAVEVQESPKVQMHAW